MEARKVLVKEGDAVIITCPSCGKIKKLPVAQYRQNNKRNLRIKCCCANVFCLCLEYRKHHRKSLKLLGKCINLSKHRESRDIIIKNISLGGIGFCHTREHRTRKDDLLQVSFVLDDSNNTFIDTRGIVRTADKEYVGCEFHDTRNFVTSLGFYLLW